MQKRPLYVIAGPTASGKTAVAALVAKKTGAEIISLDSMKIYRGMDILSAKPSAAELGGVRIHLVDVADPSESFSTARYLELAVAAVEDIEERRRIAVFEGGTALYLKALTEGLFRGPGADWAVRNRLKSEAAALGAARLHDRLKSVDPDAAAKIHPNDERRIIRALEVFETAGKPISELRRSQTRPPLDREVKIAVLNMDRGRLRRRIENRVDAMTAAGLVEEVKRLRALGPSREAAQALGYKEIAEHLEGRLTIEEAAEKLKTRTARFAKQQVTFFKQFKNAAWIDIDEQADAESAAEKVLSVFNL
jgi:tRNA dimethylallyltransferase